MELHFKLNMYVVEEKKICALKKIKKIAHQ
jgi:uncharacterized membrane protein